MRSDVFFGCVACRKPLTGGTDTFGEVHSPLCWDCWMNEAAEPQGEENKHGNMGVDEVWPMPETRLIRITCKELYLWAIHYFPG